MVTITVEPRIEERVQRLVDSGRFQDASAVLAKALDVIELEEHQRLVRQIIAEADEDIARGDVYDATPEFWNEVWEEAMAMDPSTPLPEHLRP